MRVCKNGEYKIYMWIEVTISKYKHDLVCCYIPRIQSNYYNLYELDQSDPFKKCVFSHSYIWEDWKSIACERF